jgi:NAD(P)-dependent dehydrogenase (short-subunit alcohol dehydrogenase family)
MDPVRVVQSRRPQAMGDPTMNELRFDDRAVIVTGAGRGVGRCHALTFASRGAKVVVADLGGKLDGSGSDSGPAKDVVKEIEAAGGEAVACHASVADEEGAATIVQTALDAFGRIDVVMNNAGIADPDLFEDLSLERFRTMANVHYLGTVNVTFAAWPHMLKAGKGRVVNTTSEGALGTVPKCTSYGAAKGGVLAFTKALANDAMRHGLKVNAVAPRANTRLSAPWVLAKTYDLPEDTFTESGQMDRFRPELVTPAAIFLAHESCPLNGEVLVSGGGQVMRLVFMENEGITKDDLTPEDIADNFDHVMDLSDAHEVSVETLLEEVEQ